MNEAFAQRQSDGSATKSRTQVLWISPRWPIPENDGARVATCQALRALNGVFEVSFRAILPVATQKPLASLGVLGVSDALWRERSANRGLSLLLRPWTAFTFTPFGAKALRREWATPEKLKDYDVVVLDGLHGAMLWERGGEFAPPGIPVIYRAHNVEADLWLTTASRTRNPVLRAFLQWQAKWIENFESSVARQSACVLCVTEEDQAVFRRRMGASNASLLRISSDFGAKAPEPRDWGSGGPVFGFIGKLDWRPNREGLEWLLEEVWPKVMASRPESRLKVVGSGEVPEFLKEKRKGVEFLGFVPDLQRFYAGIDALVVPIFTGSGIRVKVIEASRYGRSVIGTRLGVSGAGLEGCSFEVETPEEWVSLLTRVTAPELRSAGAAAWSSAKSRFDVQPNAEALRAVLRSVR